MRKLLLLLSLFFAFCGGIHSSRSAEAGFYRGFIYQQEPAGARDRLEAITFTLDSEGYLRSPVGLGGKVSPAGEVTFTSPHPQYSFTDGVISNGVVSSHAADSRVERGERAIFLEATNTPPGFPPDRTLFGRLDRVYPRHGVRDINRVRFTDSEFYAVGPHGTFASSDDGVHWFRAGLPTTLDLVDIVKGEGRYVAVGGQGSIFSAANPAIWTSLAIGTNDLTGVAHGNGRFVAVDVFGYVLHSADRLSWHEAGAPIWQQTNAPIRRPAALNFHPTPHLDFLNGRFVLWATNFVATSFDGINWTEPSEVGISPPLRSAQGALAFGNGKYLLVNHTYSAVSEDGKSWTLRTHVRAPRSNPNPYLVTFAQGKFWSVSGDGFRSSTNGLDWAIARLNAFHLVRTLTYGKGMFLALGDKPFISLDGSHWHISEVNPLAPGPEEGFTTVTGTNPVQRTMSHVNRGFYSMDPMEGPVTERDVYAHLQIGPQRLWAGANGGIYYARQGDRPEFGLLPVLTTNDLLAAAGSQTDRIGLIVGRNGVVLRVADQPNRPSVELLHRATTNDLFSAAYHPPFAGFPGAVVIVGAQGTILVSYGPAFTTLTPVQSPTQSTLRTVAAPLYFETPNQGRFVAAGDNGVILTAIHPERWTLVQSDSPKQFLSITYLTAGPYSGFRAYLDDGSFYHSPDGQLWTNAPPSAMDGFPYDGDVREPGHIQAINQADGLFVAVGHGFIGASENFRRWHYTRKNAAYEDVVYGNGLWVAVGWNGRIDTSPDGKRWTNRRAPVGELIKPDAPKPPSSLPGPSTPRGAPLRAITYAAGKFVAVGDLGVILVSSDGINWTDKSLTRTAPLTDVVYADGAFVVSGGTIAIRSRDAGETWTVHDGAAGTSLAWGNGRFVGIRDSGVATSTDGVRWEAQDQPLVSGARTSLRLRNITFYNGSFYATPPGIRRLYSSADGLTWEEAFTGANRHFSGDLAGSDLLAHNGQLFIVSGREIFTISLHDPGSPLLLAHPQHKTAPPGADLSLRAEIAPSPGATYQWFKDGVAIPGANSIELALTNVQRSAVGQYVLAASNPFGSRRSLPAHIQVSPPAVQSLADWARYHGVNGRLELDDDSDGLPAAAEYLLGGDPQIPGSEREPAFGFIEQNGQLFPAIEFIRRRNPSGAALRVEAKTALGALAASEVRLSAQDLGNGFERVTATANAPLSSIEKLFFLLKAELSP